MDKYYEGLHPSLCGTVCLLCITRTMWSLFMYYKNVAGGLSLVSQVATCYPLSHEFGPWKQPLYVKNQGKAVQRNFPNSRSSGVNIVMWIQLSFLL